MPEYLGMKCQGVYNLLSNGFEKYIICIHIICTHIYAYIFIHRGKANIKILLNVLNFTAGHIDVHFMILSIFLPVLNFQNPVLERMTAPVLSPPQSLS